MTAKGSCCCCSKCGVALPADVAVCCLCSCDQLCVSLESLTGVGVGSECPGYTDDCNCLKEIAVVPWDQDECAYIGEVSCGSVTVDLRFDVKICDGQCHLCLTSTCLGLDGVCGVSGTGVNADVEDCLPFTPGNINGDCGKYLRDCDQSGGWDESWTVNAVDCEPGTNCTSMLIHAECYPRVNPAGEGLNRLCKDCDCVCENLLFDYEEQDCTPPTQVVQFDGGGWYATFDCDNDQTITIVIDRDSITGCCNWKITASKGQLYDEVTATLVDELYIKTSCPNINETIDINIGQEGTATLELSCASCDEVPLCEQNVGAIQCLKATVIVTDDIYGDLSWLDGLVVFLSLDAGTPYQWYGHTALACPLPENPGEPTASETRYLGIRILCEDSVGETSGFNGQMYYELTGFGSTWDLSGFSSLTLPAETCEDTEIESDEMPYCNNPIPDPTNTVLGSVKILLEYC